MRGRGAGAAGLGLALLVTLAQGQSQDQDPGLAIWNGRQPIDVRLRGDTATLPVAAAACINCHEPGPQVQAPDAAFALRLDERLAQPAPRRGGPPVAYDEGAFCTLLRSGVDPAGILVRRAMPLFAVGDAECRALWLLVSQRKAPTAALPRTASPS